MLNQSSVNDSHEKPLYPEFNIKNTNIDIKYGTLQTLNETNKKYCWEAEYTE